MSNTGKLHGKLSASGNLIGKIKANGRLTGSIKAGRYDSSDEYASDADIEDLFDGLEEEY